MRFREDERFLVFHFSENIGQSVLLYGLWGSCRLFFRISSGGKFYHGIICIKPSSGFEFLKNFSTLPFSRLQKSLPRNLTLNQSTPLKVTQDFIKLLFCAFKKRNKFTALLGSECFERKIFFVFPKIVEISLLDHLFNICPFISLFLEFWKGGQKMFQASRRILWVFFLFELLL